MKHLSVSYVWQTIRQNGTREIFLFNISCNLSDIFFPTNRQPFISRLFRLFHSTFFRHYGVWYGPQFNALWWHLTPFSIGLNGHNSDVKRLIWLWLIATLQNMAIIIYLFAQSPQALHTENVGRWPNACICGVLWSDFLSNLYFEIQCSHL